MFVIETRIPIRVLIKFAPFSLPSDRLQTTPALSIQTKTWPHFRICHFYVASSWTTIKIQIWSTEKLMWASVYRLIKQASLILAIVFSFIYVFAPITFKMPHTLLHLSSQRDVWHDGNILVARWQYNSGKMALKFIRIDLFCGVSFYISP